jgi:hypothetical protein
MKGTSTISIYEEYTIGITSRISHDTYSKEKDNLMLEMPEDTGY